MFEPKIDMTVPAYNASEHSQTIAVSGQLDKLGLEKVRVDLEKVAFETPADLVIFDFKNLEFINSESIGFLTGVYTHLKKKNKRMNVVNMNEHVRDVLSTVGLLTLFAS